ncbi:hypothetical protein GCM10010911_69130 [Paenibacillus nasutitermitis]|uniref:Spore coat protein n=2 Tax=Paenibacillus nasutitermitis TaxID=1652958 RepID=A0A917E3K5_9BACL|nr:hypothetical protein GCM10010911_69130 [Paenibacillus nasutitermitis]
MWKMAGWLGRTVAAGLIVSFLSIWTTGYVVNSYVETLLKQYGIPLEQTPFAMSGVWGGLWGADQDPKKTTASGNQSPDNDNPVGTGKNGDPSANGSGASSDSGSGTDEGSDTGGVAETGNSSSNAGAGDNAGSGSQSEADNEAGSSQGEEETPLAVDAFGSEPGALSDIGGGTGPKGNSGASSGQTGEAEKEGLAMTTDQLNAAKNSLSDADKQELFNVIMKKLPTDSWQRISALIEGGLTSEEMTELQQLIAQNLDRTEYDRMMDILKKY